MAARSLAVGFAAVLAAATPPVSGQPVAGGRPATTGRIEVYPGHLAGRRMASGERYHPDDLVAAHPSLAFGTVVELASGGRRVRVTVKDRGPYDGSTELLVSARAGRELGVADRASGVLIEVVDPDRPPAPVSGEVVADGPSFGTWSVQIGSFGDREAAERMASRIEGARAEKVEGAGVWRVLFGRFADRETAGAWRERLVGWGYDGFVRWIGE